MVAGREILLAWAVALTLAAAGCAGPGDAPSPFEPGPSGMDPPPVTTQTFSPDIGEVPLEDRLVAAIDVESGSSLVEAAGFVWVRTEDGRVVKIDPASNAVAGEVRVDTSADPTDDCLGLGTDGESIFACSATDDGTEVVRVDAALMTVTDTFEVDEYVDQLELPFAGGRIWALVGGGDRHVTIDAATGDVEDLGEFGLRCSQLTANEDAVFASCHSENSVLRMELSGRETTSQALDEPTMIAATDTHLWVGSKTSLVRMDPVTMQVPASIGAVSPGQEGDIAAIDDEVWVRQAGSFLFRVGPFEPLTVERIVPDSELGPGGVLLTEDSVWVSATEEGVVYRLRRD